MTPDSFSDGGRYLDLDAAVARGVAMAAEGADVIDVGGESTRPGAQPVSPSLQIARVVPVIEELSDRFGPSGPRLSVDTRDADVARAAVQAGASLINDVSASLWEVAAETGVGWLAMHMAGDPLTMQEDPAYDDVVGEVRAFLAAAACKGRDAGIVELWVDPGIGFGKTVEHNLALLASLSELVADGTPVAIGTSRKRTTGLLNARSDARIRRTSTAGTNGSATDHDDAAPGVTAPDDRVEASVATAVWAMMCGVAMVRAHDVRAHRHAAAVVADDIT